MFRCLQISKWAGLVPETSVTWTFCNMALHPGNPANSGFSTGSPSSNYEHRQASALLHNIENIRIRTRKKPIVSVTYENERTSIKNSLPYLKCVLRLSCVVHRQIYGRFMGLYVNAFLSHTNPYILNVTQQCRCLPMLIFRAWATSGFSRPEATADSFSPIASGLKKPLFAG